MSDTPETKKPIRQRAILVLGMHRSGTSAVTRLFNLLGASLPGNLLPAREDNVTGFWESESIMDLHDEAMASAGMRWDSVTRFPDAWFSSETAGRFHGKLLQLLKEEFAGSSLFVVKDPRMCRMLPLWLPVLEELPADPLPVLTVRHPMEVARSLRARNNFSMEKSLLIWLWHFLDAERFTRGMNRTIVHYPEIVSDWKAAVDRMETDLQICFPVKGSDIQARINRFLSPEGQHHSASIEGFKGRLDIPERIKTAYEAARDAARGEALDTDLLDSIRDGLCEAEATFGPVVADQADGLAEIEKRLFVQGGEMERLQGELDNRMAAIDHLKDEIHRLNDAVSEKDRELTARGEAITHFQNESEALREALSQKRVAADNHLLSRILQAESRVHGVDLRLDRQKDLIEWQRHMLQVTRNEANNQKTELKKHQHEALEKQRREVIEKHQTVMAVTGKQGTAIDRIGQEVAMLADRIEKIQSGRLPMKPGLHTRIYRKLRRIASKITGRERKLEEERQRKAAEEQEIKTAEEQARKAAEEEVREALVKRIAESGLFDRKYYLERYPDIAESGKDPLRHYALYGGFEGRDPNSFFNTRYYLEQISRDPGGVGHPLVHFLTEGTETGLSPHPKINLAWYRTRYPDVETSGMNPLLHYLRIGLPEERPALPAQERSPEAKLIAGSGLFDVDYYTEKATESLGPFDDPISHYLTEGAEKGWDPNPCFDGAYYLKRYPDVVESGLNPLYHYIKNGGLEGRQPHPLFDGARYLRQVPKLVNERGNPLSHFLTRGGEMGLSPHPDFDTAWYITNYPDAVSSGLNPLVHYLTVGAAKGYDTHPRRSHGNWCDRFDISSPSDRARVAEMAAAFPREPLFSIILVGTGADAVEKSATAVFCQIYSNWELFLVGDENAGYGKQLDPTLRSDPRLKRPEKEGFWTLQGASESARGEYLIFLEPGCRMMSHTLCAFAAEANRNPGAAVMYADHDRVNELEERISPWFKPDWNPDLFYAQRFVGSMVVIRKGLPGNFDDIDSKDTTWLDALVLRAVDEGPVGGVVHIPHLLFSEPVASPASAGQHCRARVRMLSNYFGDRAPGVSLSIIDGRYVRVTWPLPDVPPRVTLIIPTRDRRELLEACIGSILDKTEYPDFEVLVVDNNSREEGAVEYLEQLKNHSKVRVISYEAPFNYSAINNYAVSKADGDLICFMNNDTEVIHGDWLTELVRQTLREEVGIVGAKLFFPDNTVQHAGVIVGKNGVAGHALAGSERNDPGLFGRAMVTREVSAVTAACLMTRRTVFETVGGFDTDYVVSFNDVDFCLRVKKAGFRVLWDADVRLVHHESVSVGRPEDPGRRKQFDRESRAFRQRWRRFLKNDPFYNINLSLTEDYQPAEPPRANKFDLFLAPDRAGEKQLDLRLSPYGGTENLQRSLSVSEPENRPGPGRQFEPGLSVVILNLDHPELIGPLLDSLVSAAETLEGAGTAMDILVGDTGSRDEKVLQKYDSLKNRVMVIRDLAYHFSKCNNLLFQRHVRYDHTLFLNNDIIFDRAAESLEWMMNHMTKNPRTTVLGSHLVYPDNRVQHSGIDFFRDGDFRGLCYHPGHGAKADGEFQPGDVRRVPAVTGACLLVRSDRFAAIGGFDPAYESECQDVDLCLEVKRLGESCEIIHAGRIVHIENATRQSDSENWRDRSRFVRRWSAFVEAME